jgi:hypothetical protein
MVQDSGYTTLVTPVSPYPRSTTLSKYDATMMAVDLGLRIKLQTSKSIKPYFTLALLQGNISYDIPESQRYLFRETNKLVSTYRLGFGADFRISECASLEVELSQINGIPIFTNNEAWGSTNIYQSGLSEKTALRGINIGLRYQF